MEKILVKIHQYQDSTFFLAISHIPVNALALAMESAQGMVSAAKPFLTKLKILKRLTKKNEKNPN